MFGADSKIFSLQSLEPQMQNGRPRSTDCASQTYLTQAACVAMKRRLTSLSGMFFMRDFWAKGRPGRARNQVNQATDLQPRRSAGVTGGTHSRWFAE